MSSLRYMTLTLLLASCASGRMPESTGAGPGASDNEAAMARAEAELHELETELQRAGVTQSIDCPQACELAERICGLASRICALGAREPDQLVRARCEDSQNRCTRARERVARSCTCR